MSAVAHDALRPPTFDKSIQNLQTLQAYIFRILHHFATKLGNFTNFKMLFLAVVKDFAFFAKMKIQFKRGMV